MISSIPLVPIAITGAIKFVGYYLFANSFFFWYGRTKETRSQILDDDGNIADDRYCLQCGYNVRGLKPNGICPECGTNFGPYPRSTKAPTLKKRTPAILLFTFSRTAIGLVMGGCYWGLIGDPGRSGVLGAWALLAPVRFAEWLIVGQVFKSYFENRTERIFKLALTGTVWSFVLDLPVILGFCVYIGGPPC